MAKKKNPRVFHSAKKKKTAFSKKRAGAVVKEKIKFYQSDPCQLLFCPLHMARLIRASLFENPFDHVTRVNKNVVSLVQEAIEAHVLRLAIGARSVSGVRGAQGVGGREMAMAARIMRGEPLKTVVEGKSRRVKVLLESEPIPTEHNQNQKAEKFNCYLEEEDDNDVNGTVKLAELENLFLDEEYDTMDKLKVKILKGAKMCAKESKYIYPKKEKTVKEEYNRSFESMSYPTRADIEKVLRRAAVTRVKKSGYAFMRLFAKEHLKKLLNQCAVLCSYTRRKTLSAKHVRAALRVLK